MPFTQTAGAAIAAAVTIAGAVSGVNGSGRGPIHSAQLPAGKFPYIAITPVDGIGTVAHTVTNTNQYAARMIVTLFYKDKDTTDIVAENLIYALDDAIAADGFDLSGTCISCLPVDGSFSGWAAENIKIIEL